MKFEEALKFGQEGEKEIASILVANNVSIIPLYQFESHDEMPFLFSKNVKLVLPDLTCYNGKTCFFVECKRKNKWIYWNGRLETGLNARLFDKYLKIKEITNFNIYIFFKHENEYPGIYYNEISNLEVQGRIWSGCKKSGEYVTESLMLFPKEVLKKIK
ncbi:MAG: hypothetical protein ACE5HX_16120 [bacterium]